MLEGIDVSRWQTTTPSLVGRSFLIAKATEGTTADRMFATHIANARAAGLVVGAYHFARDDVSLPAQVDAFLAATVDVPWIAFDVEGSHAWSPAELRQAVKRVHDAGRQVGVYMSDSAYLEAGQDWRWVARWTSSAPARRWDVWQYRGSPLDLDRFDGTIQELRTLAGQSQPEDPMQVAPLTYHQAIQVVAGRPVLDAPGGRVIYTTKAGDQFPELMDWVQPGGDYHVMRMPGDVAGFIAHGSILGTVPLPAAPADCSAQIDAAITADRASARIVYP